MEDNLGVGAGATSEMLIQTPLRPDAVGANVLSSEALIAHLDEAHAAEGAAEGAHDVHADVAAVTAWATMHRVSRSVGRSVGQSVSE